MATENELGQILTRYLVEERGAAPDTRVSGLKSLTGGACQDNYLVELNQPWRPPGSDSEIREFVFRTDKGGSLFESLTRVQEYKVMARAWQAGVPTSQPLALEESSPELGQPFYLMGKVDGNANPRFVLKDRALKQARSGLIDELASALAKIHGITPAGAGQELDFLNGPPSGPAKEPTGVARLAVESLRQFMEDVPGNFIALELAAGWLEQNLPETDELVLVHGDFRTGNFMVNEQGLRGVLDWEFAHWGDRHEDIAWLCMRDWRFGKLKQEAGGLGTREDFLAAYEKASGVQPDPDRVRFWEIVGNARWAIGARAQAFRHLDGKDRGIELAAIGRRACEMEFELMRLIENAGQT